MAKQGQRRRRTGAFTLGELAVIVLVVIVVATMLLPMRQRGCREDPLLARCKSNLSQIGKSEQAYMNIYSDFWSYQEDGRQGLLASLNAPPGRAERMQHNACVSLAALYPNWVADPMVFACPATQDRPIIVQEQLPGVPQINKWFGKMDSTKYGTAWADLPSTMSGGYPFIRHAGGNWPDQKFYNGNVSQLPGRPSGELYSDYATNTETAPDGKRPGIGFANTSYGYDDIAHFRDMVPGSPRLADMRYQVSNATTDTWTEMSNHGKDGQHVLYWDGHVSFTDSVYASNDPLDNIYTPQNINDLSKDCVLVRTHCDALKPAILPKGANPVTPWVNW
jgi:hypothetical protein